MQTLHLNLKAVYFDAIAAGEKREEYRLATPYWRRRLEGRQFGGIVLKKGYPQARRQLAHADQAVGWLHHQDDHACALRAVSSASVCDHRQLTKERNMPNQEWIEHAYPLQQITIQLQGTRHSDRTAIVNQLENVLARLRAGEPQGEDHDDDFGYRFTSVERSPGPSFFDEPAGSR